MKKICIIGHFGFGQTLMNGQTIKTKIIASEIEKHFGSDNVVLLDLAGGIKKIPALLVKIPPVLCSCSSLIMLPVENGLRFLTPVLRFWNTFLRRKLHYVVIGGWLPEFIAGKKHILNGLKHFNGIYVETNTMKKALTELGLDNLYVMPNFKRLRVLDESELVYSESSPHKLCTFSRVMKEKGIETAVNAVKSVNDELGYTAYTLDIYGQIDENQTEWFENLKSTFPDYIKYGGIVPFDKSVEVLKDYFALLFPTYYEGEGFAGTLVDSYSAGIPVIASDWKYNSEIINENTGYVYPIKHPEKLVDILKSAEANPAIMLKKKKLCVKEAEKYSIDKSVQVLISNL